MAFSAHKTDDEVRERFDTPEVLSQKLDELADLVRKSRCLACFTGAGISTSAGIPDFRGPQGKWTLEAKGEKRTLPSVAPRVAFPTATHMALVELERRDILKHLISQNCDGLHRKSGFNPNKLYELHGCSNIEECEACHTRFYRDFPCHRLGRGRDHFTGRHCALCSGRLLEWTIDFGQNLPEDMLNGGFDAAHEADVHLVLGSSLTVSPACDMPKRTGKKKNGKLVIVNLQHTPLDDLAHLRIYAKTDDVMVGLMQRLGIEIPGWVIERKVLVAVDEERRCTVTAVFPHQEHVPASLFRSVMIRPLTSQTSGVRRGSTKDDKDSERGELLRAEPFVFADRDCTVDLEFHSHYGEPRFGLSWRAGSPSQYITLQFDPFQSRWTELGREIVHELSRMPKTITQARNGGGCGGNLFSQLATRSWPSANLVYVEGQPVIVMVGGVPRGSKQTGESKEPMVQHVNALTGEALQTTVRGGAEFLECPRWGHSGVTFTNGRGESGVLIFGGWNSSYQFNDVVLVQASTRLSTRVVEVEVSGSAPCPRSQHGACVLGGKMYVFGGMTAREGKYTFHNDLFEFDLSTNKWTETKVGGTLPCARAQCAFTAVGQYLFVIGGNNGQTTLNDIHFLDTQAETPRWVQYAIDAPLPVCEVGLKGLRVPAMRPSAQTVIAHRSSSTSVVLSGPDGVHVLDLSGATKRPRWQRVPEVAVPDVSCHASVVVEDKLVRIGGVRGDGAAHEADVIAL